MQIPVWHNYLTLLPECARIVRYDKDRIGPMAFCFPREQVGAITSSGTNVFA